MFYKKKTQDVVEVLELDGEDLGCEEEEIEEETLLLNGTGGIALNGAGVGGEEHLDVDEDDGESEAEGLFSQ
jgi:hypothetical protein